MPFDADPEPEDNRAPCCEADDCEAPAVYREDYQAFLCDTHAEVPSFVGKA